jgi:DNA replication protein DnaC
MNNIDPISDRLEQIQVRFEERNAKFESLLKEIASTTNCQRHPKKICHLNIEAMKDHFRGPPLKPVYGPCPVCVSEERLRREAQQLRKDGVPAVLANASLESWKISSQKEEFVLDQVREYAESRGGFLVLLGDVGTGKSHLAVGVMRTVPGRRRFVKQQSLLNELRMSYRGNMNVDPVASCQSARLLVIDDLGLSSGGKDEHPMLHDILDYRYGEFLPTILTSNLNVTELEDFLGPRLFDRIRESGTVLSISGKSKRLGSRDTYMERAARAVQSTITGAERTLG